MNKKNKRTTRKKRVTCIALAAVLTGSLTMPVWADEQEVSVEITNDGAELPDEKNIEITSYLKNYKDLVDKLGMSPTDPWQFIDQKNAYMVDQFYIDWESDYDIWSMKNEGASYVKIYDYSLGDSIEEIEKTLLEKEWVDYYSDDKENLYLAVIDDKSYMLALQKDENADMSSWYFCNWPEGDDVGEFLEASRNKQSNEKQSDETQISVGEMYEYADGQFLSDFSIEESEGKKRGILAFWHNYGDSASDEDFFFDWEDGKWDYELTGSRSGKKFLVNFTPTESGMQIKVTCTEGAYYSWETGQSAEEWVNAEYTVK